MIIVWILSYFAVFMLGVAVTAVATLLTLKYQDKQIEKVDMEMRLYGYGLDSPRSNRPHAYHNV